MIKFWTIFLRALLILLVLAVTLALILAILLMIDGSLETNPTQDQIDQARLGWGGIICCIAPIEAVLILPLSREDICSIL